MRFRCKSVKELSPGKNDFFPPVEIELVAVDNMPPFLPGSTFTAVMANDDDQSRQFKVGREYDHAMVFQEREPMQTKLTLGDLEVTRRGSLDRKSAAAGEKDET
jgi:hypothetical protein